MKETGKDISNKETPDIDIDKEKEGGTREGKLLSEQIDSLKRKNAILKGQIEILEEKMFGNTPLEVDKIEQIMEWHKSLMPKLMETPIGRSFVTAKLRERLLNNGNEAKVVYTGSGGNPLIWPKKLRFSHEVEYSYMVGSNGLGLCIDGEIVYVPYYRWGNFEVVRL